MALTVHAPFGCFTRPGRSVRVLRPGGAPIGSDSLPRDALHHFHEGDTYNPVEPGTFLVRLRTLGYERITVGVGQGMTFVAHRPGPA